MPIHFRRLISIAAVLWGLAAVAPGPGMVASLGLIASAHAQPQPINRLATRTSPLTAQEQTEVAAFVEYWVNQVATGDPEAIRNAIRALDEPLNRMGVTRVFRDEYSRAIIPRLENVLGRNSNHEVAVNALKVGSMLGTERAMRLMVDYSDSRRETREAVRLWAAKGFQALAESDQIDGRQLTNLTRDLARVAKAEENWLVLRRQFEALAAAPDSLSHQVEVLVAAAQRVAESENAPNPTVESLHRALVLLRNQWMNIAVREQRTFGESAGSSIVRVLEIAEAHWDDAHDDERASEWYRLAVQAAETLLISIDLQVRPNRSVAPEERLHATWRQRDREAFIRHLRTWQEVTGMAPYARAGG